MWKTVLRLISLCLVLCLLTGNAGLTPVRAAEEALNVKDYGASGNGVTDDLAAIQAAIDDASSGKGGGTVTFPAGTYLVTDSIQLKSNVTLLLDDGATILNGITSNPSIVFLTGPFTDSSSKTEWADTENITVIGGTIDMNGALNADGSGPANLGSVNSSGAFALGYATNVRVEDVTFLDTYKGHAIQVCACHDVTIRNCTFRGMALPNTLTDSQKNNLEIIQIEPSTTAGFPYATNETGEASTNVTIEGCYFGASDKCGEPSVAVGTHNQKSTCEKCADISILNNTFDNMMYAGVRFCGYEDVLIQNNTFIKKSAAECVNYRENGCFLINLYCYNNTEEELDMNRNITINGNRFQIADSLTRGIRVAKDKDTYIGTVTDITITNNTIVNTAADTEDIGIQALRISDNLTITGNSITGGYRGIEAQYCTGDITITDNDISDLTYQYVRFIACGDKQTIYFYTHGGGTLDITTSGTTYTLTAVPNPGWLFDAYYKENALSTPITTGETVTVSMSEGSNVYRHPNFVACSSHSYQSAVTAPTCTEPGFTTHTCTLCGYSYTDSETAAAGHSWSGGVCTVCGVSNGLFDISYASMTMGNSLAINFAFAQAELDDWTGCYTQITKTYADGRANVVETVPYAQWQTVTIGGAVHYYVTFDGVAAKEMSDEIYVTIYNADGEAISNTKTDSVRAQSMRILDSVSAEEQTMIVDMLNYGAAAQTYFGYNTSNLATALLSDAQKAYASEPMEYTDIRTSSDASYYLASNVNLESSIQLMLAFKNVDTSMYAVVSYKDHYGNVKAVTVDGSDFVANGSFYVVMVDTLVVADGRQAVTCTIYSVNGVKVVSVTDSLESYTARKNGESELFTRMMQYSDSAYSYFH